MSFERRFIGGVLAFWIVGIAGLVWHVRDSEHDMQKRRADCLQRGGVWFKTGPQQHLCFGHGTVIYRGDGVAVKYR